MHLGQDVVIRTDEIVCVFDLDNSTVSKNTREFLRLCEKSGRVVNVSTELPKSFVLCSTKKDGQKVYISQISSATLLKRAGFMDEIKI